MSGGAESAGKELEEHREHGWADGGDAMQVWRESRLGRNRGWKQHTEETGHETPHKKKKNNNKKKTHIQHRIEGTMA